MKGNDMLFIPYDDTKWRIWQDKQTKEYNGPEVNGSVLAYSTQTTIKVKK